MIETQELDQKPVELNATRCAEILKKVEFQAWFQLSPTNPRVLLFTHQQ